MRPSNFKRRAAFAGTVGVTALIATLGLGASVASATPADPPGGVTPTAPSFNNGIVNTIRGSGSDTTIFMMQKISDLYTQAGLYGCQLNDATGETMYNSGITTAQANSNLWYYCKSGANISTSDPVDNWSRTEVTQGVDDVGSTAGQKQLCGSGTLTSPLTVDFARSSKPAGTYCADLKQTGYAKDSVPAFDFQVNPSSVGTVTSGPYATINDGVVGPVAKGWLPGDPTTGPFKGTKLTNLDNTDNGGANNSTPYRLWCATDSTRITDWGQLTNLGPNLSLPDVTLSSGSSTATLSQPLATTVSGAALTDLNNGAFTGITGSGAAGSTTLTLSSTSPVSSGAGGDQLSINIGSTLAEGSGGPIGVPIRIMGVNTSSGTEATWQSFADSGVAATFSGNGCGTDADQNAASDPNSSTATGDNAGKHIGLENNASQISDFANADWPSDAASAAVEVATTLYYESNGVYLSTPYSGQVTVNGAPFSGTKLTLNGTGNSTANVLNDVYPTSRTLFNIYRTGNVKASTAGFLNWICDSQTAITKQKDNSTGVNFDQELTNIIGSFQFIRLTDTSASASNGDTPPDNVSGGGINTSCASGVTAGAGNGTPAITAVAQPEN